MKVLIQKSEAELVRAATQWLRDQYAAHKVDALFLPAGNTPRPLYAEWRHAPPPELQALRLLQMDEVLEGAKKKLFQEFFRAELPALTIEPLGQTAFSGSSIAILGLGLNGHVAFHEPKLPRDFAFGELKLDATSAAELGVPSETLVKSYGLGTFLKCASLLLLVTGAKKKAIFARFLANEASLPASALQAHPNLTVLVDAFAS